MFLVLWEYEVKSGSEKQFEDVYGPAGDWARLFRTDSHYRETRLLCDPFPFERLSHARFLDVARLLRKIHGCSQSRIPGDRRPRRKAHCERTPPWRLRNGDSMNRCQFSIGVNQFSPRSAGSRDFPSHMATNPSGSRSGWRNFRGVPATRSTASAARYPLRTAPSIVAGQPVAVQSPARNNPRTDVSCFGRQRSTPGSGEKVAAASLITVAFTNCASRAAGSAWRTSLRQKSIISWRDFGSKSYDALITSCRYCPPSVLFALPFASPYNSVLLKIHCVVVSSRVTNGSFITWRSNQKCTPVMGETFILSRFASDGSLCFTLSGSNSASAVCGTAKTYASAFSSFPSSKRTAAISPFSIFKPRTGARRCTSPPRRSISALQPSYKFASGTAGTPMRYPVRFERNAFQKTSTPKRASVRSNSSSSALTSTTRQNRSIAPAVCPRRRSHSSIEIPPFSSRSAGCPFAPKISSIARP